MNNKKKLYISVVVFAIVIILIIVISAIYKSKKYVSDTSKNSNNINKTNVFENYEFSDDYDDTNYMYLTESNDYFFLVTDYGIYKNIYKISKETGTSEILCSNPQCTHEDETCSAYLGIRAEGMWIEYYDDRLYYTESFDVSDESRLELWIMSMNLEGKDRKKELKINDSLYNSENGYGISMKLHGKELYITKTYNESDEKSVLHSLRTEIYKVDLDTNEMEKIYEKSHLGISAGVYAKKDNIVYIYMHLQDENDEFKTNSTTIIYDTATGNITEEYEGIYSFTGISGDDRFYTTPYENEGKIYVKKAGSEEYEEVYNMGKDGTACDVAVYDNYIIINNWPVRNKQKEDKCITILDTNGNFIKKINTYGYTSDTKIANGFLFVEKKNEDEQYDIYVCPLATDADTWTKIN